MKVNHVYHGDCLEVMKEFDDKSIDLIISDLPYGVSACKWDVPIPLSLLWEQYKRLIKESGSIILTATQPFSSILVMSNIDMFRYEWIWKKQKPTNFYHVRRQPLKEHESILVFSKSANIKYNPQGVIPVNVKSGRRNKSANLYSKYSCVNYVQKVGNYPRSIIFFPTEGDKNRLHPTQKPVALFEYLIKTYTNEGDLVLDNCAGSGTTGVACINTNRNYILIEKEKKYYDIILKRLDEAIKDKNMKLW